MIGLRTLFRAALLAAGFAATGAACAQAPEAATAKPADAAPPALEALSWLEGCWRGSVNQREFREHWMPLRGGMLLGVGQTVIQDKTQDVEFLRIESRPDGVHYVTSPPGKKESSFKLVNAATDNGGTEYVFANAVDEFPQRVVYRRATEGWLYAWVEGKLNGEDRKVIYPMRRIGCESGEFILK